MEGAEEVCEEGMLAAEGQDPLLHHGALHIVVLQNHVFLQSLHCKELLTSGAQHLGQQNLQTYKIIIIYIHIIM